MPLCIIEYVYGYLSLFFISMCVSYVFNILRQYLNKDSKDLARFSHMVYEIQASLLTLVLYFLCTYLLQFEYDR